MEDNYDAWLDDDPRAPDQRTPPPSPPPRQGGEPDQPGVAEDTGVAEGDLARVELRRGGSNMDPKRALTIINTREVGRTPSQLQWIGYSWYPF